ncbi:MAG: Ig-like domain-containing protein [Chloroflexota bacterium]
MMLQTTVKRMQIWTGVLLFLMIISPNLRPLAAQGTEVKLTASDVASEDDFGYIVAISGDTAVVGARLNNDAGTHSGSAYIYQQNEGGTGNWGQLTKLTASDAAADDEFGASVSISGDTIAIAAWRDDESQPNQGSVYIFQRDQGGPNNWGQVTKLTAGDGDLNDGFGISVSISDDSLVVGARHDSDAGASSGSAYIFQRDQGGPNNWGQVAKLTASDAATNDRFGTSVAISNDLVIIGANYNSDAGSKSGSAYIFQRDQGGSNNWGQVAKLTASDATAEDRFGVSVSISGDTAIVGSRLDDDAGSSSGSAYIYQQNEGGPNSWGQLIKLTASDADVGDQFGEHVAISGDHVFVGAPTNNEGGTNSGAAYLFHRDEGGTDNWEEISKLTASDADEFHYFATSVALDDQTVLAGASGANAGAVSNAGAAYLYPLNQQPDATNDRYDTPTRVQLTVPAAGVLSNDTDPEIDPLTAILVDDVTNGDLVLNPDGSFTYLSDAGFVGNDTFIYKANDGTNDSNIATVTITVEIQTDTCQLTPATIVGTEGDDIIIGTEGDDVINGLDGNDTIMGNGGNDKICGSGGDDFISGGPGDDEAIGGSGNDEIHGNDGIDLLRGSGGDDDIYGGPGDDDLRGSYGNDALQGNDGIDRLAGGSGNDYLEGNEGDDRLYGNSGDDELHGNNGDDLLRGNNGDDLLFGEQGDDDLRGNVGDDVLHGNEGNDLLRGSQNNDVLNGNDGDDDLDGGAGPQDVCSGGSGTDTANRCETVTGVP